MQKSNYTKNSIEEKYHSLNEPWVQELLKEAAKNGIAAINQAEELLRVLFPEKFRWDF